MASIPIRVFVRNVPRIPTPCYFLHALCTSSGRGAESYWSIRGLLALCRQILGSERHRPATAWPDKLTMGVENERTNAGRDCQT